MCSGGQEQWEGQEDAGFGCRSGRSGVMETNGEIPTFVI